jgi:hypothetical protein
MSELKEKSALILEREEKFAIALAAQVINKPQLSLWMILIPIFFVFYFNNFSNLIDKKRALNEAVEVVDGRREPDIRALAELSNMDSRAWAKQAHVLAVLVEHYTILLNAHGEDFASLVREAYGSLTNYLLFLNRLNQAESEVNEALKPNIEGSYEEISDIVSRMEDLSERLRRETAESIFQ